MTAILNEKPLVGIMPRRIWVEHRVAEVADAIKRYALDGKFTPEEWSDELVEHARWLRDHPAVPGRDEPVVDAKPEAGITYHRNLTLGEFIEKLEAVNQTLLVRFDTTLATAGFSSYRGHYEQLALSSAHTKYVNVASLLADAKGCVGCIFEAFKGGDYKMELETPLWAANWGRTGLSIVDVVFHGDLGCMEIITRDLEA